MDYADVAVLIIGGGCVVATLVWLWSLGKDADHEPAERRMEAFDTPFPAPDASTVRCREAVRRSA